MKIIELRHFDKDYLVYVNTDVNIKQLSRDARFKRHAVYKDSEDRTNGIEFRFPYRGTMLEAKRHVRGILKGKKK